MGMTWSRLLFVDLSVDCWALKEFLPCSHGRIQEDFLNGSKDSTTEEDYCKLAVKVFDFTSTEGKANSKVSAVLCTTVIHENSSEEGPER